MSTRTLTLSELIRVALERRLLDVHVSMPAQVLSYNPVLQLVTVQPLLMGVGIKGDESTPATTLPVLQNVPVLFPGAGGFRLTFPILPGDTVTLVCADRCLDTWKSTAPTMPPAVVDPVTDQGHAISDAFAIPGGSAPARPWAGASLTAATIGADAGPQALFSASDIKLGSMTAAEAFVLGTTYRSAQATLHSTLQAQLAALASAEATPLHLPPAAAASAAAITACAAAIAAFEAQTALFLSTIVKGQ